MDTITKYQVRDDHGNTYGTYVLRELALDAIFGYQACPISAARGYKYEIVEIQAESLRFEYAI